jgi:DNA polymerase-3 subunit delta
MIYLLYGTENYLIEQKIKEILKENNLNIEETEKYNYENTKLKDIIKNASTYSLFNEKRAFIISNSTLFTALAKKEEDIKELEKYLANPNPYTILIFKVENEKLDERKKIVKLLKTNTFSFNNASLETFVKENLKDYQITSILIKEFLEIVGNDLFIIDNELNKLKTYKDDKIITSEDVNNICSPKIDVDLYALIDKILTKDKGKAYAMYQKMLLMNTDPMYLLISLANQFRLLLAVKIMAKDNINENEMVNILGIHPYRVKMAIKKAYPYKIESLIKIIKKLALIDEEIKLGNSDKNLSLELFILNL